MKICKIARASLKCSRVTMDHIRQSTIYPSLSDVTHSDFRSPQERNRHEGV